MAVLDPHQAEQLDRTLLAGQGREVINSLDKAIQVPPTKVKEEVAVAERALVIIRNHLIYWLRQNLASREAVSWRKVLDQVNSILSCVVGTEYPAAGVQREPMKEARDAMKKVVNKLRV